MSKKIIKLFVIISLLLTGCSKENKKIYSIKKVSPYLYEVNYTDYKYDTNLETLTNIEEFGCSSVKNGNFYGRNFDFIFNDVPEFIVKVPAKEGRHASIGVAIVSSIHENDNIENKHLDILELLPNATLDGINDSGVICSDNVVPKEDTAPLAGTIENKPLILKGLR